MNRSIGVEVDAGVVSVVETLEGAAVSARTFRGADSVEALKLAFKEIKPGKKTPPVRVALVSSATSMRRLDLTRETLSSQVMFSQAAYQKMTNLDPDNTIIAGLVDRTDLVGEELTGGAVVANLRSPVEEVYRTLAAYDVEVVPTAFTLAGRDGLHLAVRHANSDLTLTRDGKVLAHRRLGVGGLARLAESLGAGDEGWKRLNNTFNKEGLLDAMARDEVNRFMRSLSEEVLKSRESWARSNGDINPTYYLLGVGSSLPELVEHLEDVGLTRVVDEDLVKAMAYIPLGDRAVITGALLAGRSQGSGLPYAVFPSPVLLERAKARTRGKKQTRVAGLIALALLVPVLIYAAPTAKGALDVRAAENENASVQAQLDDLAKEEQLAREVRSLERRYSEVASADPKWGGIVNGAYSTAQSAGVSIQSVNGSVGTDGVITVSAGGSADATDYGPLTAWLRGLAQDGAENVNTTSFAAGDTGSSFQVTFTVPREDVTEERELGQS